jgi:hypothetical protein
MAEAYELYNIHTYKRVKYGDVLDIIKHSYMRKLVEVGMYNFLALGIQV